MTHACRPRKNLLGRKQLPKKPVLHVRRRGAALLAALVVLLVVMLLSASLVRGLIIHRRQLDVERRQQQAMWFADSAVQRAVARLKAAPDYMGESWQVEIEVEGAVQKGVAEIRVLPVTGEPQQRLIQIDAVWPNVPLDRVLEKRELQIQVSNSGAPP